MRFLRSHWRSAARLLGVILLLMSVLVLFLWFYLCRPYLRIADPEWVRLHSTKAYWQELQKSLRRSGWHCDEGCSVGAYADKRFMERFMSTLRPDEELAGTLNGRKLAALQKITNQDCGDNAQAWLTWWEKNKTKSQKQWIVDGFAERGVKVHCPPETEDFEPLLLLLGSDVNDKDDDVSEQEDEDEIPVYVWYNAFRWLRDSGIFDPISYAISDVGESTPEQIKEGLRVYSRYEEGFPKTDRVGILAFGGTSPLEFDDEEIWFLSRDGIATVYSLILIPLVMGLCLVIVSIRRPKKRGD